MPETMEHYIPDVDFEKVKGCLNQLTAAVMEADQCLKEIRTAHLKKIETEKKKNKRMKKERLEQEELAATPVIPTPAPIVTPPVPKAEPVYENKMTGKAEGSYEDFINAGWTDALLLEHGYMAKVEVAPAPPVPAEPPTPPMPSIPNLTIDQLNAELSRITEEKLGGDFEKMKPVIEAHNNGDWHLAKVCPSKYNAILADARKL